MGILKGNTIATWKRQDAENTYDGLSFGNKRDDLIGGSQSSVHQPRLEGWLKCWSLGPAPQLSDSEFAFLTSFLVRLMLLVPGLTLRTTD